MSDLDDSYFAVEMSRGRDALIAGIVDGTVGPEALLTDPIAAYLAVLFLARPRPPALVAADVAEAPAPVAASVEPCDLDVHALAVALGCSARTIERAIVAGRFTGDAAPVVVGGLERKRYRWRVSQLAAVRAVFAPPLRPVVSPPIAPSPAPRSKGRPPTKRKAKKADEKPYKTIAERLRDGD